jgi:hypothetical protein
MGAYFTPLQQGDRRVNENPAISTGFIGKGVLEYSDSKIFAYLKLISAYAMDTL